MEEEGIGGGGPPAQGWSSRPSVPEARGRMGAEMGLGQEASHRSTGTAQTGSQGLTGATYRRGARTRGSERMW